MGEEEEEDLLCAAMTTTKTIEGAAGRMDDPDSDGGRVAGKEEGSAGGSSIMDERSKRVLKARSRLSGLRGGNKFEREVIAIGTAGPQEKPDGGRARLWV